MLSTHSERQIPSRPVSRYQRTRLIRLSAISPANAPRWLSAALLWGLLFNLLGFIAFLLQAFLPGQTLAALLSVNQMVTDNIPPQVMLVFGGASLAGFLGAALLCRGKNISRTFLLTAIVGAAFFQAMAKQMYLQNALTGFVLGTPYAVYLYMAVNFTLYQLARIGKDNDWYVPPAQGTATQKGAKGQGSARRSARK